MCNLLYVYANHLEIEYLKTLLIKNWLKEYSKAEVSSSMWKALPGESSLGGP